MGATQTRKNVQPTAHEYKRAVALTTETIHRRTTRYRTLVVIFVLVAATCILGAAIQRSWLGFLGLLLLIPLGAAFFSLDAWLVARWRRQILELWADSGLDLQNFRKMMMSMAALPPRTVAAMVDTLPLSADADGVRPADAGLRRLLVQVLRGIDARDTYGSTARAAAITLTVVAMITAAAGHTWTPVFAVALAPVFVAGSRAMATHALRRAIPAPSGLRDAGLTPAVFVAAVSQIAWRGIPAKQRNRFLKAVSGSPEPGLSQRDESADLVPRS
jgi:hypothetical protein